MFRSKRTIAGFAVSIVFIYLAFRGQDFGLIADTLRSVNYWWLLPGVVLYFAGVAVRAWRWSILLSPVTDVPLPTVFRVNAIGLMANNILPLRTGEIVRAYVISQETGITKTTALATIAVDRLFDGLTMVTFILVAMPFVDLTDDITHVAIIGFIIFIAGLVALVALSMAGDLRDRLLQVVLGPLPTSIADRVEKMAESFISGLSIFSQPKALATVFGASIVAWGIEASVYWCVAQAFGTPLSEVIGWAEAILTTGVANLATLVPSSPGYVGPFDAAIVLVVSGALGMTRELALSYALVVHAFIVIPVTIWGLVAWLRMNISFSSIQEMRENPAATIAAADIEQIQHEAELLTHEEPHV